jgi:aminoglycoside phosphotransferase (APT) family kinase protein
MALLNKIEPDIASSQLTAWLRTKLPYVQDVQVSDVHVPSASGMSCESVLFEASWREDGVQRNHGFVARVAPVTPGVFPSYDLGREGLIMGALSAYTAVPAPRIWFDPTDDVSVLAAPFLVMERLHGRVAPDDPPFTTGGWVLELSPDQQATLFDNALQVLAAVHRVDWRELGLESLARREYGAPGLDEQLGYWTAFYAWAAQGEAYPVIDAGLEWVREHRPTEPEPLVLNWGDARVGNMLIADDLSVAGVLDWEMATLASPELDLGWWQFMNRHHSEGVGAPLPPGFPSFEQTVERYQELTGHEVEHIEFYEVFAALRASIIMVRAGRLMIELGLLPHDAPMSVSNPASHILAKQIGAPAPTMEAVSWIGNR